MRNRSIVTWIALLVGEACLAALAVGAFWWQDWRYSLPTPRPAALKQSAIGERLELPAAGCLAQLPPPHFSDDATIAVGYQLPANQMPPKLVETNRP